MNFHPGHPTQIVSGEDAATLIEKGYSEFKIQFGDDGKDKIQYSGDLTY